MVFIFNIEFFSTFLKKYTGQVYFLLRIIAQNDNNIKSCRTVSEVGGKDVSRGDQQLFAQMCHLLRTHCQQAEHALHHLCRVYVNALLIDAYDVRQERQRLDLCGYEVDEHFLVERGI